MPSPNEERAARAGATLSNSSAERMQMPHQATLTTPTNQAQWMTARELERRSIDCARQGLTLRGADRFLTLALASTYALAARDTVLVGSFQ